MTENTVKLIFIIASVVIMFFAVRRGYRHGLAAEVRMVVSVAVALLCLILILVLRHALKDHTYGTAIVIAAALLILGTGWRIIKTIIKPLSGFKELRPVRAADAFLGALAGAAEGALVIAAAVKIYMLIQG